MQNVLLWGEVRTGVTVERLLLHLKHSHLLCTGTCTFWILRTWVLIPSGCRRWRAQKLNLFGLPLYASWISLGFWDYHQESLSLLLYLQILILKKGRVKVKVGVKPAAEWIPAGYYQWKNGYWVTFTKIFMSQRKLYHWSCGKDFECVCFPYLPQMQQITCPTLMCPVLSLQGYQPSAKGWLLANEETGFFLWCNITSTSG